MTQRTTTLNTKRMLGASLRAAMATKPLDKVTVSELVAATGVNRKTFYYHFVDIPDLLVWVLDDEAIRHVDDLRDQQNLAGSIDFTLRYVDENQTFLRNALDALGRERLRALLYGDIRRIVDGMIDARRAGSAAPDEGYLDLVAEFCTEGIAGQLVDRILRRSLVDRSNLRDLLVRLLDRTITAALG